MESNEEKLCDFAEASDVGCVRELNEDSICSHRSLWLVADGMGGHASGEVASAIAVDVISNSYGQNNSLETAIQQAHKDIIKAGMSDTTQTGMGTTVVAMTSDSGQYEVAWVGDSRAYLWNGKLTQLSEDHSLMVRLVNAGLISAEDALTHPQRHMITQCLGSTEIETVKVDTIERNWDSQEQILLCSDGLTDEVSDAMIAKVMGSQMELKEKVDTLVKTAKQAGGRDNISLIIIESPIKKRLSFVDRIRNLFGG